MGCLCKRGPTTRETLLRTAEQDDDIGKPRAAKRRHPIRGNTDDAVQRAIGDHFASVPLVVRASVRFEGGSLSLHEKVTKDYTAQQLVSQRLGASYWQELQEVLEAADCGSRCRRRRRKSPSPTG